MECKMDAAILLTAAGTVVAIVGSNIALIGWLRSDMKSFENKIENKIDSFTNDFRKEMASYKNEVSKEMKDFHGRLCSIEERNKRK